MNFTQSFEEFSTKLGPTDLALYAGVGIVLWVLFKDKLTPIQKLVLNLTEKMRSILVSGTPSQAVNTVLPVVTKPVINDEPNNSQDIFFKLVVSWKQTRDLAVKSGCSEAVKVADQMFPFLSPNVCTKKQDTVS